LLPSPSESLREYSCIPVWDHQSIRNLIPALPFCKVTFKAPKPPSAPYPKRLKTLGDHLRKKRLDLKLQQKELAKKLGVSETSIYNWENNLASPSLYSIPKIIKFLGYLPNHIPDNAPVVKTLGEKIATSRRLLGLTQEELAHRLDIDPDTLRRWEKDKSRPSDSRVESVIFNFAEVCRTNRDLFCHLGLRHIIG